MASDQVIRMMRSNGAPFPDDLLERLSDQECWSWMYANKPKKPKVIKQAPSKTVCFTGFTLSKKLSLSEVATSYGWRVIQSSGPTMSHLCTGETPGPKKIEAALKQGATVVTEAEFIAIISNTP